MKPLAKATHEALFARLQGVCKLKKGVHTQYALININTDYEMIWKLQCMHPFLSPLLLLKE